MTDELDLTPRFILEAKELVETSCNRLSEIAQTIELRELELSSLRDERALLLVKIRDVKDTWPISLSKLAIICDLSDTQLNRELNRGKKLFEKQNHKFNMTIEKMQAMTDEERQLWLEDFNRALKSGEIT